MERFHRNYLRDLFILNDISQYIGVVEGTEQQKEVARQYISGCKPGDIAKEHGICKQTVMNWTREIAYRCFRASEKPGDIYDVIEYQKTGVKPKKIDLGPLEWGNK